MDDDENPRSVGTAGQIRAGAALLGTLALVAAILFAVMSNQGQPKISPRPHPAATFQLNEGNL